MNLRDLEYQNLEYRESWRAARCTKDQLTRDLLPGISVVPKLGNMRKPKILITMSILSLTIVGACASKSSNPSASVKAASVRVSEKGTVMSLREFDDYVCDLYASLDLDKDGYLNPKSDKIPAWIGSPKQTADGRISIVEFVHAANEKFNQYAKTNKGSLTVAELAALEGSK